MSRTLPARLFLAHGSWPSGQPRGRPRRRGEAGGPARARPLELGFLVLRWRGAGRCSRWWRPVHPRARPTPATPQVYTLTPDGSAQSAGPPRPAAAGGSAARQARAGTMTWGGVIVPEPLSTCSAARRRLSRGWRRGGGPSWGGGRRRARAARHPHLRPPPAPGPVAAHFHHPNSSRASTTRAGPTSEGEKSGVGAGGAAGVDPPLPPDELAAGFSGVSGMAQV